MQPHNSIIKMAAVVRLKRRLSEEPLNALIINCKKQKRNDYNTENEEKEVTTVLKFVGTVNNQEEDLAQHILKPSKLELEEHFKKHTPDIVSKIRQQTKENSQNNRLKIVNLFRARDKEIKCSDKEEKIALTVVDVETENDKKTETLTTDYVYDLYYTNSEGFSDSELNNVLSICPVDELVYGSYRDNGKISDDSDHETDDSNDENNWRNDYPDEEDADSVDEEDMRHAVNRLTLDDNLSDDDGEEGFVYSIDSEEAGFEEDLDHSDVRRYGELYARFKARQKKEEEKYNKDFYNEEIITDDEYSE